MVLILRIVEGHGQELKFLQVLTCNSVTDRCILTIARAVVRETPENFFEKRFGFASHITCFLPQYAVEYLS